MPKYIITVEDRFLSSYEVEAPDLLTARFKILTGACENSRLALQNGHDRNFVDEQLAPEYDPSLHVDLEDE